MSSGSLSAVRIANPSSIGLKFALVILGSLALAVSAQIKVPFWPVPMTMQTFVVMMIGLHFGPRLAVASVVAYLAEGLAGQSLGIPVFASATGLFGPTGGYLVGFLAATILISSAVSRGYANSFIGLAMVLVAGELIVFALGWAWLSTYLGAMSALVNGIVVFVPAEALKITLALAAVRAVAIKH